MKISESLFEIARKDLEAAKCLFESGFYPQAVFYLQQSVEKANKSLAVVCDIIREEEVKAVGHDPLKIYIKSLLGHKKQLERSIETIKKVPKLKEIEFTKNLDFEKNYKVIADLLIVVEKYYKVEGDSLNKIKFLGNGIEEIIFVKKDEIRSLIRGLNQLELQEMHLKGKKISMKDLNELKSSYIELLDVFYPFNPKKIEKLKEGVEKYFTLDLLEELVKVVQSFPIKNAMYVSYSLYLLSLIMLPHAIVTRYPDNNYDPLKIYNKNLPLIQLFDVMVKIMEKTLSKMENLLFEI